MLERIELPGADLRFDAQAFADIDTDALHAEILWETHRIRLFGRWVDSPRLSCWMGDAGASYRYSGALFQPHAWTPGVSAIRDRVQARCGVDFNSVLINLYRDGRDHMGWHRDDERELGARPVIASVSLGATRRFLLRANDRKTQAMGIDLTHGSLLMMAGDTQINYRHALAKTAKSVGPRINLTFRCIRIKDIDRC